MNDNFLVSGGHYSGYFDRAWYIRPSGLYHVRAILNDQIIDYQTADANLTYSRLSIKSGGYEWNQYSFYMKSAASHEIGKGGEEFAYLGAGCSCRVVNEYWLSFMIRGTTMVTDHIDNVMGGRPVASQDGGIANLITAYHNYAVYGTDVTRWLSI